MGRILLYILAIPVVLVVLAALLVPLLVNEEKLISIAASQLQDKTGAELTVSGPVSLSLFPRLGLEMADVRIDAPDSQAKLQAGELSTGLAVMPLLRGSVEIDAVNLRDLTVTTVAQAEAAAAGMTTVGLSDAELDALYAKRRSAREAGKSDPGAGAALALPLALNVARLSIENARLLTVDEDGSTLSTVILEDLSASDLNTAGRPVPMTALVRLPGADNGQELVMDINGEFRPDLKAGSISVTRLDIDTTGLTQRPLSAHIEGSVDIDKQVADLTLAFTVDQMLGNGSLRYAAFESPQIDAELSVSEFNPALLALAGPDAAAQAEPSAEADPMTLPYDALRSIDTVARLRIDRVVIDRHVMSDVTASLRAQEGKLTLEPVQGRLHDGDIDFSAELNARYNPATLRTQGSVENLDIASAVRAMRTPVAASGRAGLDWEVSATGDSTDTMVASLTGPIRLRTDNVTVSGVNAQRQFCQAVALVNQESLTATFQPDTVFSELEADINLADGQAQLDPLSASLPALGLTGSGTLDLTAKDFRASIRATIRDTVGLDPACRVNERLADLRWPVECEGNLADEPASWCRVNTREILKDLAEGEVRRQVEEEAGKLLQKMFGGDSKKDKQ